MELRNEVGRAVGMDLPGTLVFDYPTVAAIAAYVISKQALSAQAPQETTVIIRCQPLTNNCVTIWQ